MSYIHSFIAKYLPIVLDDRQYVKYSNNSLSCIVTKNKNPSVIMIDKRVYPNIIYNRFSNVSNNLIFEYGEKRQYKSDRGNGRQAN